MTKLAVGPSKLLPPPALVDYYENERGRRAFITRMFDETATHYDWIAGVMSLGCGSRYRRDALRRAGLTEGMEVLDVAIGTGAVARCAMELVGRRGNVVGLDPSRGMLGETRKALPIPLVQGLAEQLPFREAVFDLLSMGFALRHVSDLRGTLREYFRVLRPGGVLLIMDFAHPRTRAGYQLIRFYLGRVVPWVAQLGSGSRQARLLMRYCWDTIEHGVPSETVFAAIAASGFRQARRTILFGILSEYVAVKP